MVSAASKLLGRLFHMIEPEYEVLCLKFFYLVLVECNCLKCLILKLEHFHFDSSD